MARTKASRLRTASRYQQYQSGKTASITEASFQYDVLRAATFNGWRIDLDHTTNPDANIRPISRMPDILQVKAKLMRCFPRKGIQAVRDFLLKRSKPHFTLAYHTHDSRKSQAGFPDLVLVHPERPHIIFAELKDDTSYPSTEQRLWAAALLCVNDAHPDAVTYHLWRPKHYAQVIETLGGLDPLTYL